MHDQFASTAAIFSLMFLYFQHFGYGTTAVYLGLMLDPDAFDRQFERIEMIPPPLWRAAVAAAVATSPLVLESLVSQLLYQLLVGAVAILITGTCDSHVFRYGKSDGRSGKLGMLADAIASINLWLSLLTWFALLNWIGIDLHFELFLHDLSLLPASPTISSQIIDQAAWYTLYSFTLIRAMGPSIWPVFVKWSLRRYWFTGPGGGYQTPTVCGRWLSLCSASFSHIGPFPICESSSNMLGHQVTSFSLPSSSEFFSPNFSNRALVKQALCNR